MLNLRRGCFEGWTSIGVAPLTSSTPCRRIRLRLARRDQFTRPDITHFLATRALHSKAAGENNGKAGGFALAPQTMFLRQCRRFGNTVGAVEPESRQEKAHSSPVRPGKHTPALRGFSTNWVDGSESVESLAFWIAARQRVMLAYGKGPSERPASGRIG